MQSDLRTIKTERIIFDILLKLLSKKSIDEIAVKEICEQGSISRHAFYLHFYDKYDLLKRYSESFIDEIVNRIEYENKDNTFEQSIKKTAEIIFEYLSQNQRVTLLLIKNDVTFWQTFSEKLQSLSIKFSDQSERVQIFAIYSVGALINCLREYYAGNIKTEFNKYIAYIEEIALKCNDFMKNS